MGQARREYVTKGTLHEHPQQRNNGIYSAEYVKIQTLHFVLGGSKLTTTRRSNGQPFIVKRMPNAYYELAQELQELKEEIADARHLREVCMHVGYNENERAMVYEYIYNSIPETFARSSKRSVGGNQTGSAWCCRGCQGDKVHDKDWIHIGGSHISQRRPDDLLYCSPRPPSIKPDNFLVD